MNTIKIKLLTHFGADLISNDFHRPYCNGRIKSLFMGAGVLAIAFITSNSYAQATNNPTSKNIPDFSATFVVNLYGIDLGDSQHQFHCSRPKEDNAPNCRLTTDSSPKGLASWFVKDSAIETIKIRQADGKFLWHGYQKHLIRPKGSEKKDKFTTYQVSNGQVYHPRKDLQWDWSKGLFDTTSIVYAIQWHAMQNQDLNQAKLILQSSKHQYPLSFSEQYKKSKVQLEYGRVAAEQFRFGNERYEIDLWLLPQTHYFPGKVRIHDREEEQTLTLTLKQAAEFK